MSVGKESTDIVKEVVSRQVSRKQERNLLKQKRSQEKFMNGPAIRHELVPFMNQVKAQQKQIKILNDRITLHDITIHTLRNVLIDHKIISEKDMLKVAEQELSKFNTLQEIQKGEKDYSNRIEICQKHDIPVEQTCIPYQLREDTELLEKDKKALLKKYKIKEEVVWPKEVKKDKT